MIVPTLLAIGATENGAPAFMLVHPLKTGGSTVKEVLKQYALRHNSSQTVSNCETPSYPSVGRTEARDVHRDSRAAQGTRCDHPRHGA